MLIPKKEGAKCFSGFWPISLIGSIYKLLAKVLPRRHSESLKSIIGDCQHAFVEGRQITDAIMIANEVVDDLLRNKKRGILCKLDMEKAFDNVSWDFIDYMFEKSDFGIKWRRWIRMCISSTSFAVMINGGPSFFVNASRDLRQGDPLFPLLFILVMEALNKLLEQARTLSLIKGITVGKEKKIELTHLFFAEDTLLFCQTEANNLLNLRLYVTLLSSCLQDSY